MLFSMLVIMLNSGTCYAQDPISLPLQQASAINEFNLWRRADSAPPPATLSDIRQLYQASLTVESTIGQRGAFVTKLVIHNTSNNRERWFVNLHANYLDQGLAYWQSTTDAAVGHADFSQGSATNAKLAHAQAFPLFIESGDTVELWIHIEAKLFSVPVTIRLIPESQFYYQQFQDNILTTISITVMLTLALMAVFTYIRTRQMIILACAGYVGLHGLGWFAASGQLSYLFNISAINPAYAGMLIFPFAIAAASQFTKRLFNCPQDYSKLSKFLHGFSLISAALGILMWLLPFAASYLISHLIAALWIPISISIGFFMLGKSDFRAKYYLVGNLTYGLALAYYVLSHTRLVNGILLPELVVLLALTVDCICIMLSLSEWIHLQQKEYYRSYTLSRIDPLTQVGNRHLLSETLDKLSSAYYLTFIDFDNFKQLNDTQGHEQGDRYLIECAGIMQRNLQGVGEVFRTGGDEFIWLIVRKQNDKDVLTKISQLITQTEQELRQAGWHQASLSYGVANSYESVNLSECLSLADKRMYEHKRSKKEVAASAERPDQV